MNNMKKALVEQQSADMIARTVERVQHFKMLEKKFGPKKSKLVYVYDDGGNPKQFSEKEYLETHVKSLAKEAKEIDPNMKDKSLKEIIKHFNKSTYTITVD